MTDSDSNVLSNNVFTFSNQTTTFSVKGPNINSTISGLNFRNNMLASTMNMPWNSERSRYAQSEYDQRCMPYRRETTPMSLHSGHNRHPRNIHNSYYRGGGTRSNYNGRSGTPESFRSMDSNMSMTATNIALAFKNVKFNKFDLRKIKDAYNKFLKNHMRKRVEKKRKLRVFVKGGRRRSSGEDSGEQDNDSSISSDDYRSIRTCRTKFRENLSSSRSTRTTMMDSNMYKDCTDNFRQNKIRNISSVAPASAKENNLNIQNRFQNTSIPSQKDRFKNGFVLPSQRFNASVASKSIPEKPDRLPRNNDVRLQMTSIPYNQNERSDGQIRLETDSEQEEIFANTTKMENRPQRRTVEGDICVSSNKRSRSPSPQKNVNTKTPVVKHTNGLAKIQKTNDFEFAKPQFPIRKSGHVKKFVTKSHQTTEKVSLVAKSPQPTANKIISVQAPSEKITSKSSKLPSSTIIESPKHPTKKLSQKSVSKSTPLPETTLSKPEEVPTEKLVSKCSQPLDITDTLSKHTSNEEKEKNNPSELTQLSTTDMSMRPSFIKRKLFSQKADIAEAKNASASSDNIQLESPKSNIYRAIQKEKNRTRKLVTSQSCMNRDLGDESNLLDLIHKIVPADRMNMTMATNRSEVQNQRKSANAERWDVSTIITTCVDEDVSDTFTDEEIFKVDDQTVAKVAKQKNEIKDNSSLQIKTCKIVVEKLPPQGFNMANKPKTPSKTNGFNKTNVYNCVKSFWDTDVDSDIENEIPQYSNSKLNENQGEGFNKTNVYNCVKSFWDTDVDSDIENEIPQYSNSKLNENQGEVYRRRTRKLVTSQSCMNRDLGDESNLLDLIHKIVPADRMNMTMATNRSEVQNQRKSANAERWDVSTIITTCVDEDVSDTFTDEEIFKVDDQTVTKVAKQKNEIKDNSSLQIKTCKIVVEKLPPQGFNMANKPKTPSKTNGFNKTNVYNCVKSFWDTDVDSDIENEIPQYSNSKLNENQGEGATNQQYQDKNLNIPSLKISDLESVTLKENNINTDSNKPTKVNKTTAKLNHQSIKKTQNTLTNTKVMPKNNAPKTNLNNTLKVLSRRSPKINRCCDDEPKPTKVIKYDTVSKVKNTDVSIVTAEKTSKRGRPLKNLIDCSTDKSTLNTDLPKKSAQSRKNNEMSTIKGAPNNNSPPKTLGKQPKNRDLSTVKGSSNVSPPKNRKRPPKNGVMEVTNRKNNLNDISPPKNRCRTRRSKEIDRNNSLLSNTNDTRNNLPRICKSTLASKEDKLRQSDVSFTLTVKKPPLSKSAANRTSSLAINKNNQTEAKTRSSDVSFSLTRSTSSAPYMGHYELAPHVRVPHMFRLHVM